MKKIALTLLLLTVSLNVLAVVAGAVTIYNTKTQELFIPNGYAYNPETGEYKEYGNVNLFLPVPAVVKQADDCNAAHFSPYIDYCSHVLITDK